MIFQILIYGLSISEIKDQNFLLDFFFSQSLSWDFYNKKKVKFMVTGEGVQICIAGSSKQSFFFKYYIYIYIYIYNFGSGGSFEPPDYNVSLPLNFSEGKYLISASTRVLLT